MFEFQLSGEPGDFPPKNLQFAEDQFPFAVLTVLAFLSKAEYPDNFRDSSPG
jgi:hypothetical protein